MAIGGKKKIELTMDSVLEKVSDYDIFRWYMPTKDWKLNEITYSPFRNEKNPSFIIGNKRGYISFIDFGNTEFRGDCFTFVKKMYNLANLDEVLKKIDADFGLGISSGIVKDYKKITGEYKQPEIVKRNTLIQVVTRKFTGEELAYWNTYHQDLADLRANNIYSIKSLYLNKKIYHLKDTELRFGYFYPSGGYWKIYVPYAKKKNKWIGNVPLQTSWGTENLLKGENSLICKSLKDYMVCKKVFPYVCGVQNESLSAFSEKFVETLKSLSPIVFYGGDSDNPGKKASYEITNAFKFKHINPPDYLLNDCCKDFADMGKFKGLNAIKEHFIKKNLIQNL